MVTKPRFDAESFARSMRGSAFLALREAARFVTKLYDDALKPEGLCVTEMGVLRVCAAAGPIDRAGLARELATNRASIAPVLQRMVEAGLLVHDRAARSRQALVQLTPQGRQTLARAVRRWDEAQRDVISRLGEARWNWLRSQLAALSEMQG